MSETQQLTVWGSEKSMHQIKVLRFTEGASSTKAKIQLVNISS